MKLDWYLPIDILCLLVLDGTVAVHRVIEYFVVIRSNLKLQKVKVEGEPLWHCVGKVHPGSDHTSRLVARSQVPRHEIEYLLCVSRSYSITLT